MRVRVSRPAGQEHCHRVCKSLWGWTSRKYLGRSPLWRDQHDSGRRPRGNGELKINEGVRILTRSPFALVTKLPFSSVTIRGWVAPNTVGAGVVGAAVGAADGVVVGDIVEVWSALQSLEDGNRDKVHIEAVSNTTGAETTEMRAEKIQPV